MPTYYKALNFDGVDDSFDCGNHSSLQITNHLSVGIWLNCGSQGTADYIAMKYWTNQMSWAMRTGSADSTKLYVQVSTDGTTGPTKSKAYESPTGTLSSGEHLVGFTFGAGVLKIWVDGVDITSTCTKHQDPAFSTLHNSTQNLEVCGFTGYSNSNWTGDACNLFLFDTGVLSATDWSTLNGSGTPYDPVDLVPTGSASIVSAYLWDEDYPLVPGANDVVDRVASNDGTTQGSMVSGDVVDTPWIYSLNCLYAPDGYTVIPDSALYPGQYIRTGETDPTGGMDSTTKGLVDLACNANYLHKRITKTYVRQDLQSYTDADKIIATTGASPIHVASWRIDHLIADQGFRVRCTAKTADANAVDLVWKLYDFATHTSTMSETDTFSSANYLERVVDFDPTNFAAYIAAVGYDGPHFLELWVEEQDVGGVAHLKTVAAESVDDGGNELTSGVRASGVYPQCWEAWTADSPLSVDQMNTLGTNLEALRTDKASTFVNYCDDLQDLANPSFETHEALTDWQLIVKIPVDYQPGVSTLGVAVAGFYADSTDRIRIYSNEELDEEGFDGITERQFSGNSAAFDITTAADWVVATVPVRETVGEKGSDVITLEFKGSVSRGVTLVALEIWEVY